MNATLALTVVTSILDGCKNKEITFSPLFRPTITVDNIQHQVLKVRLGKGSQIEANIVNDLWVAVSFTPHTNGFIDSDILVEFINAEISK